MTTLRDLANTADAEERYELAWELLPMRGPNSYQVRANLPGGRVIVCGATGSRRDWVRTDMARLLGHDPKHLTVRRIRRRPTDHQPEGD